jgi:putative colanic acid biosynthesis acetyltransferase WcaF
MAWSPHPAYGFRRWLLRRFGMEVAPTVKIRRSVHVDRPWNVRAGELTIIGDDACILAAEPVTIGARCVVSQLAVLATVALGRGAAGGPERAPVTLEDDAWVASDVLVLPGSTVRRGAVVGARGTVEGEIPAWRVAVGRPAVARGTRSFGAATEVAI